MGAALDAEYSAAVCVKLVVSFSIPSSLCSLSAAFSNLHNALVYFEVWALQQDGQHQYLYSVLNNGGTFHSDGHTPLCFSMGDDNFFNYDVNQLAEIWVRGASNSPQPPSPAQPPSPSAT